MVENNTAPTKSDHALYLSATMRLVILTWIEQICNFLPKINHAGCRLQRVSGRLRSPSRFGVFTDSQSELYALIKGTSENMVHVSMHIDLGVDITKGSKLGDGLRRVVLRQRLVKVWPCAEARSVFHRLQRQRHGSQTFQKVAKSRKSVDFDNPSTSGHQASELWFNLKVRGGVSLPRSRMTL